MPPRSAPPGDEAADPSAALVVLCGRSFAGKSTAARWLQDQLPAVVVSLDAINAERGLRGGQGIPLGEWQRTNELARSRAATSLVAGGVVVVDDTSSPRVLRDAWWDLAVRAGARFALVHVDVDAATLRARLLGNRRTPERPDVVDAVMAEHLAGFEPPQDDERPLVVRTDASSPGQLAAAVRQHLVGPSVVGVVRLCGELRCRSEAEVAAVAAHLPDHVALTRGEPGCLRFDVVPSGEAGTWRVEEAFSDESAFRAHRARAAASAWGRATAGIERRYTVEGLAAAPPSSS